MTRTKILIGNWKMYKTGAEAATFAALLNEVPGGIPEGVDYVICPPFTALHALGASLPSAVKLGAQNVYFEAQGAFTGEVSAPMLAAEGVSYVIVGHSERRQLFGESDELVRRKVHAIVEQGMTPVLCVGEDLRQRELDHTLRVVERQTTSGLAELTAEQVATSIIAYEPIWAIGSGRTATAEDADSVIRQIRACVAAEKGQTAADGVRILYGGSVKPENIAGFTSKVDIDGALVGGASLQADSFVKMAQAVVGSVK